MPEGIPFGVQQWLAREAPIALEDLNMNKRLTEYRIAFERQRQGLLVELSQPSQTPVEMLMGVQTDAVRIPTSPPILESAKTLPVAPQAEQVEPITATVPTLENIVKTMKLLREEDQKLPTAILLALRHKGVTTSNRVSSDDAKALIAKMSAALATNEILSAQSLGGVSGAMTRLMNAGYLDGDPPGKGRHKRYCLTEAGFYRSEAYLRCRPLVA